MTFNRRLVQAAAIVATLLLSACGGSDSDTPADEPVENEPTTGGTGEPIEPSEPGEPVSGDQGIVTFTGFYQEDAGDNPEDPLPGEMYLNLPAEDGAFDGEFLFSYSGCDGGLDTGRLSGNKSTSSLSGSWAGTVDLVSIGGTFEGTAKADTGGYSGTYLTNGGKTAIDDGDGCSYFVAGRGTWELFPVGAGSEDVTITVDNDIVFSWNSESDAEVSLISVYGKECLADQASIEACSVWNQLTTGNTATYGNGGAAAVPLVGGDGYLVTVVITAGSLTTGYGAIERYASGEFIAP